MEVFQEFKCFYCLVGRQKTFQMGETNEKVLRKKIEYL